MGAVHQLKLSRDNAGLLVIDFQERLVAAMEQEECAWVCENARRLIEGARILGLPIWVTEQYPKGIGPTIPQIAEVLSPEDGRFEKVEFSCAQVPAVAEAIATSGRKQLIVCGMEAHICVYQTARDFIAEGYQVFVPADGVISRAEENEEIGLHLLDNAGAVITSAEVILFDLLEKAGTPEFKKISAMVK